MLEEIKSKLNSQVKLDGGKTSDEDGKIVSYEWKQSNGPDVKTKNSDETATFDVSLLLIQNLQLNSSSDDKKTHQTLMM